MKLDSSESEEKRMEENFPVASFLIPKKNRDTLIKFYHFARNADDIADNPDISAEKRRESLREIKSNLISKNKEKLPWWALSYLDLVEIGKCDVRHGKALLSAFIQDTEQNRYDNWEELIHYCMRSAAPVGRTMLEIHQEWSADIEAADALCNILQILNHLQDLKKDYLERDRVYFPIDWVGDVKKLAGDKETPEIRAMINRSLDKVDDMLEVAEKLPNTISGFRIRCELCVILYVAKKLANKLRVNDPIASRVSLNKVEYIACFISAIALAVRSGGIGSLAKKITKSSKSSFLRPMMSLEKERREAMFALYAFCRVADDAADEAESPEIAKKNIDFWRKEINLLYDKEAEIDYPTHVVTRSLIPYIKKYGLKDEYFHEILNGQNMDSSGLMNKPSLEELDLYCYRVASCVGLLSIEIFGYKFKSIPDFAIHLGKGMQIINILRDVKEDAERGRIYLPYEILKKYAIDDISLEDILNPSGVMKESIERVMADLGKKSRWHLSNAEDLLPESEIENMRPALLMKRIYGSYLEKMEKNNWDLSKKRVGLCFVKKFVLLSSRVSL